eukprot:TRINITY_DN5609_c0_g1_i1.p3 TRINITY_DN5609_c0_g1~~TRINITY_DN5609_c0_g1_i1.p3  ORF type:complete len:123 (+),score=37.82 TRINITY_DN5609_c0_g1_i1:26-370(+)
MEVKQAAATSEHERMYRQIAQLRAEFTAAERARRECEELCASLRAQHAACRERAARLQAELHRSAKQAARSSTRQEMAQVECRVVCESLAHVHAENERLTAELATVGSQLESEL